MDYSKFLHGNGAYYAWVEIDSTLLSTEVPVGAKWGTKEDGTQKILGEFLIKIDYSIDESTCLILLAAMERATLRTDPVNTDDLDEWNYYLSECLGVNFDQWLTLYEYHALMQSDAYNREEE